MKIIRPTLIEQGDFESTAPPDGNEVWEPVGRDFLTGLDIESVGSANGFGYFAENESGNTMVYKVDLATGDISQFDAGLTRIVQVTASSDGLYFSVSGKGTAVIGTQNPALRVFRNSDGAEMFSDSFSAAHGQWAQWSHDDGLFVYSGVFRLQVVSTSTWNSSIAIDTYRDITKAVTGINEDWHAVLYDDRPIATHGGTDHCSVIYRASYGTHPNYNYRFILLTVSLTTGSYTSRVLSTTYTSDYVNLIHNSARNDLLLFYPGSPKAVDDQTLADVSPSPSLPACNAAAIDSGATEMVFRASSVSPKFQRVAAADYVAGSSLDPVLPSEGRSVVYDATYYVATLESGGYALIDRTDDSLVTQTSPSVTKGDVYTYQNKNYEALADNSDRPDQGAVADPPTWLNLGAVNRLRMFDGKLDTLTTGGETLVVDITPGQMTNGIALFNVSAQTVQITMTDPVEGEVYDSGEIQMLDNSSIKDWYSFFFEPYLRKADVARLDLPPYPDATITVTISAPGESVSVGQLVLGQIRRIGKAQYGTSVGITDFSRKEQDQFGNFIITPRRFSKRAEYDIKIDTNAVAGAQRTLASFRTTPLVWVGAETQEETIVYGYYRDFDIILETFSISDATITVEGL